ncbi:MAG: sensor histidine kinase [Pseudomonadota bacterium]
MPDQPQEQPAADLAAHGVRRPIRGPFEAWPKTTDLIIVLVSLGLTLAMWAQRMDSEHQLLGSWLEIGAYLLAFVASFSLLWRRTHPLAVHAIVLGITTLIYLGPTADGVVALVFSLYSLGRYEPNSRASLVGAIAAFLVLAIDMRIFTEASTISLFSALGALGIWYAGRRLRFRGEYLRLLEERARHLERERHAEAESAVAAERTRIAREMHDVVAHQVSLMTVQAGAARTVSKTDPAAAGDAMAAVESAGRNALEEMRHLLGVLRPADAADALDPQPGIDDIPNLVQHVQDAGPHVTLETRGTLTDLPARLELNAYRIVQESLTNVIKHAGPDAAVSVTIEGHEDRVIVTVTDNGTGSDGAHSGGHGIVGMRERVEMLGGRLHAGARTEGGFEVRAELPTQSEAS